MIMGAFTWLEKHRTNFKKLYKLKKRKLSIHLEPPTNTDANKSPKITPKNPFKPSKIDQTPLQSNPPKITKTSRKLPSWAKKTAPAREIDRYIKEQTSNAQKFMEEF